MSRYELRFLRRHPFRWARCWWLHLTVVAALFTISGVWTSDLYDPVRVGPAWPIAVGVVAALLLASAIAPLEDRLVAVAAAALITLALTRSAAYIELAFTSPVPLPLLVGLASKWMLIGALGVTWPQWTRQAALTASVEAGRDA